MLDYEGLLQPYGARFTQAGTRPERVLEVTNAYNQNGSNGFPLKVRSYNFLTGEGGEEELTLEEWGRTCYRE